MIYYRFNREKSLAAILYILSKINNAGLYKIGKILYYADQKHLVKYGTPITGDCYVARDFGSVPSKIYDIFKEVRDKFANNFGYQKYISVENGFCVKALAVPDLDEFSESDVECLDDSIKENKDLNFDELKVKSHDLAYKSACQNKKISVEEIAKEGGANKEMIKYIRCMAENNSAFS